MTSRPSSTSAWFALALLIAGLGILLVAVMAAALGGGGFHLGPIHVSIANPLRAATQGFAVLLLRETLLVPLTLRSRLRTVALLGGVIVSMVLQSTPRIVGDGYEYVAMAWNLSQGRPPALTPDQVAQAQSTFQTIAGGGSLVEPALRTPGGLQCFYHSFAYSLVAAPFLWLAGLLGIPWLVPFTVLNILLMLGAAFLVLPRLGTGITLLLFSGPILWWVDKAHGEALTFSLSVVALVSLSTRPGVALPLLGYVGFQNPTLGVGFVACAAWVFMQNGFRQRPARLGLIAGGALLAAGPLYNLALLGHPSPLAWTILPHRPSFAELWAVLLDTNIGLLFEWPSVCAAAALGLIAAVRTRPSRSTLVAAGLVLGTLAVLLFSFSQPANLNHGATRGVSRYAMWLVPLAVPLLLFVDSSARWARVVLPILAGASFIGTFADYQPGMRERYLSPTRISAWLWNSHPSASNPLPEVFAERNAGFEITPGVMPAATPGCVKALLAGDDTDDGLWPLWCRPATKPQACRPNGVRCYANATPAGPSFVVAPSQPAFTGPTGPWAWRGAPRDATARFLAALPWSSLRYADPRKSADLFAGRRGPGRIDARQDSDVLLVWIQRPRQGAYVDLLPAPNHRAVLLDPQTGKVVSNAPVDAAAPTRVPIPWMSPLLLVVAPVPLVPPDLELG